MVYERDWGESPELVTRKKASRLPKGHVKRDDLISKMLQDRNTLRVISAPHGFGKTALANEYAVRMFAGGPVCWVDGSNPDFLVALDSDEKSLFVDDETSPGLLVIDDLPWLHEQRARTLSRWIDSTIFGGVELIITTVPSCDCLGNLQSERLLIGAEDLLVGEREFSAAYAGQGTQGKAIAARRWRMSNEEFLGRTPHVALSSAPGVQVDCAKKFFSEPLELPFLQAMHAMVLLRAGSLGMLEELVSPLHREDIDLLACDYPVFGIDFAKDTFEVGEFKLSSFRSVIATNGLGDALLNGNVAFVEKVAAVLFKRGEMRRGVEILDQFCSDEKCACWLSEQGWELLDRGEMTLVASLLERCPEHMYAKQAMLQAMHAWLAGLSGDSREACHIAKRLLQQTPEDNSDEADVPSLMARLALAAFNTEAILFRSKRRFSAKHTPLDGGSLLANAIDSCTDGEIARAFHINGGRDDPRYQKNRRNPSKQRVRGLTALLTESYDRLGDSHGYLLALHMLAHIDDSQLRKTLQELGCDAVVEMRRSGVKTFTQALLVRDLWNTGYFGLVGPVTDRRDVRVLDGASHMLATLARCCGAESVDVPWESHASGLPGKDESHDIVVVEDDIECMRVRLFGSLDVMVGERYINEAKWRKKARAMFALLVLNLGRDVPRDELFRQIWPNASRTNALDSFYILWSNCTAAIGENPYLERNGEFCRVDPRYVKSDVGEFEQLTRHLLSSERDSDYLLDTYAKIEALYRGPLLPSEHNVALINTQRERYRALFVDAMVAATDCALGIRDTRIALWFARKAMEEDSEREDVYRALMKSQIAAGQRCPAIKTYLRCRDYLQGTLGLDPSLETRELYDTLVTTDPALLRLDSSSFSR